MKVRFIQSGGMAGLLRGCTIDPRDLPPPEAAEFERLVRDASLGGATRVNLDRSRDLKRYEVLVVDDDGNAAAVLECDDGSIPDAARPLIAFLRKRARPLPPDLA